MGQQINSHQSRVLGNIMRIEPNLMRTAEWPIFHQSKRWLMRIVTVITILPEGLGCTTLGLAANPEYISEALGTN